MSQHAPYVLIDGVNKQPLSGATITAGSTIIITDEKGIFNIPETTEKISISYVGYRSLEFIPSDTTLPKVIELERSADELDAVSVVAPVEFGKCSVMMGGVSFTRIIKPFHQFVFSASNLMGNPALKVYPNPVIKGQTLTVQFSLPVMGQYAMQVFAADGRLIEARGIQINSKKQLIQVEISPSYTAGVYWIYVVNTADKGNGHQVKFIVR